MSRNRRVGRRNTGPAGNGPAQLPTLSQGADIDKILREALNGVVEPAKRMEIEQQLRRVTISKSHSGPLPSVDTVEGYEKFAPGSFNRIITMAEKDQDAVIASNKDKADSDSRYRSLTTVCGLVALILILAAIVYLAMHDHDGAAIAIATMGAAGIITAFVNGRMSSSPPSA